MCTTHFLLNYIFNCTYLTHITTSPFVFLTCKNKRNHRLTQSKRREKETPEAGNYSASTLESSNLLSLKLNSFRPWPETHTQTGRLAPCWASTMSRPCPWAAPRRCRQRQNPTARTNSGTSLSIYFTGWVVLTNFENQFQEQLCATSSWIFYVKLKLW